MSNYFETNYPSYCEEEMINYMFDREELEEAGDEPDANSIFGDD